MAHETIFVQLDLLLLLVLVLFGPLFMDGVKMS